MKTSLCWVKGGGEKALVKSSVVGKKFAKNSSEHCTWQALSKMYKRTFRAFVDSRNAEFLTTPSI
jgi:hypothetical protein